MSEQALTITSTESEIQVLAQDSVTLFGGGAAVELKGANITFKASGTFTVKAASTAFSGGGSNAASIDKLPDQTMSFAGGGLGALTLKTKRIKEVYWTFGVDRQRLSSISRHYVDMNLHIQTENYNPGESVCAEIFYEDGDFLLGSKKKLSVSAVVDASGLAVIERVFKNGTLNLK